jgi:ferredoxin
MLQGHGAMPKVTFVKEKMELEVPQGANLRNEALKAGVEMYAGINRFVNCFGHGSCGTCRVAVKKGAENLSAKGAMEKLTLWRMLSVIGREQEARLACQCSVLGDCTVETTPELPISPEADAKGKFFWETPYPNK